MNIVLKKAAVLVFALALLSVCKSNESADLPKPHARIDFELKQAPLSILYLFWEDCWYIAPTLVITEHSGVGATITDITIEWYVGENVVAKSVSGGGRISANGSREIFIESKCPAIYRPEKIKFVLTGRDDNGYRINVSKESNIVWPGMKVGMCSELLA